MANIKCKMCGGELKLTEVDGVAKCEYCGAIQKIIPDNDQSSGNTSASDNKTKKSKKTIIIAIAGVAVVLAVLLIVLIPKLSGERSSPEKNDETSLSVIENDETSEADDEDVTETTDKVVKTALSKEGCYAYSYIPNFGKMFNAVEYNASGEEYGVKYITTDALQVDKYIEELEKRGFVATDYGDYTTYALFEDSTQAVKLSTMTLGIENRTDGTVVIINSPDLEGYMDELYKYNEPDLEYLGEYIVTTKSDDLIAHTLPKSGTPKVFTIPKGKTVTVVESCDGWALVQYGSKTGWVSRDYIEPVENNNNNQADNYNENNNYDGDDLVNDGIKIAGKVIDSLI